MEVAETSGKKPAGYSTLLEEALLTCLNGEAPISDCAQAVIKLIEQVKGPTKRDKDGHLKFDGETTSILDRLSRSTLLHLMKQAQPVGDHVLTWQGGKIRRLLEVIEAVSFLPDAPPQLEAPVYFALLEELMDMSVLPDCEKIFYYIESKGPVLVKVVEAIKATSKLGLLRTFNKLLKRLSKTRDAVLNGRILMFMATLWPLSERSAANVLGFFNSAVEVDYSQEEEKIAEGLQDDSLDPTFYKTVWGLQNYFRHPPTLATAAILAKFTEALQVVLTYFKDHPLSNGASLDGGTETADAQYDISYLTSPRLLSLQLRDPNFRRHLLLQALLFLQWLRADRRTVNKTKSVPNIPAEGGERLATLGTQAKQLLRSLPPQGEQFAALVEHLLEREKNWLLWKFTPVPKPDAPPLLYVCPPSERKALEGAAALHPPGKKKAVRRIPLGNEVLGRVWNSTRGDPMMALRGEGRQYVPPYLDYMRRLADELDPDNGIEEEFKVGRNKVYEWRGLRLSARHNVAAFSIIAKEGGDLTALLPKELRPATLLGAKGEMGEDASQAGGDDNLPQDEEEGGGEEGGLLNGGEGKEGGLAKGGETGDGKEGRDVEIVGLEGNGNSKGEENGDSKEGGEAKGTTAMDVDTEGGVVVGGGGQHRKGVKG